MTLGSWVISVVGVVMLTIVVDVILPEGETNKYIKNVMSIIIILALIRPLPSLLKGDFLLNITPTSQGASISTQENLLNYYLRQEEVVLEDALKAALQREGIEAVNISVEISERNNMRVVSKVLLNLPKKVINGEQSHIYNLERVSTVVTATLGISENCIIYE